MTLFSSPLPFYFSALCLFLFTSSSLPVTLFSSRTCPLHSSTLFLLTLPHHFSPGAPSLISVPILSVFLCSSDPPKVLLNCFLIFRRQVFVYSAGQAVQLIGSNVIKVTGSWLGSDSWGTETQTLAVPLCVCAAV